MQALGDIKVEIANLRGDIKAEIASLRAEIANEFKGLYRWLLVISREHHRRHRRHPQAVPLSICEAAELRASPLRSFPLLTPLKPGYRHFADLSDRLSLTCL